MRINTNVAALNAWRNLTISTNALQKSLEKITSGYRINRAGDDAAGLAVSEKMRSQIRGLNQAVRNAQDGISLIQTAEGGAAAIQDMLQRMKELATQAANGSLQDSDRQQIDQEFQQLLNEIDRTAKATKFNQIDLLNSTTTSLNIQVGPNNGDVISLNLSNWQVGLTALSITNLSVSTQSAATSALTAIANAVSSVNSVRAQMGAYQNRLENTINVLQIQAENLTNAESRIRDVDMALEMARYTKYQVLVQAGTAMLAQANQAPQAVMQLLR